VNAETAAAPVELTERLQLYSRYVAIVVEQLQALAAEDSIRITELDVKRRELEDRLNDDPGSEPHTLDEFLDLGLAAIEQSSEGARQLEERWIQLSGDALRSARRVGTVSLRNGSYPDVRLAETRFDRRL
jgi:hypothetical protein